MNIVKARSSYGFLSRLILSRVPPTLQTFRYLSSPTTRRGEERPFRVLGLQQVAIGGLDRIALKNLWCNELGLRHVGYFESEKENVREDILRLGKGVLSVEVDLMEPIDTSKRPRVNTPALNHIGLWIDDLQACFSHLQSKGLSFTPGGVRPGAAGHDVAFLHPKGGGQGVLIELVQAPQEVIDAFPVDSENT
eukprot:203448_1